MAHSSATRTRYRLRQLLKPATSHACLWTPIAPALVSFCILMEFLTKMQIGPRVKSSVLLALQNVEVYSEW